MSLICSPTTFALISLDYLFTYLGQNLMAYIEDSLVEENSVSGMLIITFAYYLFIEKCMKNIMLIFMKQFIELLYLEWWINSGLKIVLFDINFLF